MFLGTGTLGRAWTEAKAGSSTESTRAGQAPETTGFLSSCCMRHFYRLRRSHLQCWSHFSSLRRSMTRSFDNRTQNVMHSAVACEVSGFAGMGPVIAAGRLSKSGTYRSLSMVSVCNFNPLDVALRSRPNRTCTCQRVFAAWFFLGVVKLVTFSLRRPGKLRASVGLEQKSRRAALSTQAIQQYLRERKMTSLATYKTLMKARFSIPSSRHFWRLEVYATCDLLDRACDLYDDILADGISPDSAAT